jgi:hypothetical protein
MWIITLLFLEIGCSFLGHDALAHRDSPIPSITLEAVPTPDFKPVENYSRRLAFSSIKYYFV